LREKASADILLDCAGVSTGGSTSDAAVETLDPAGAPDVERANTRARCAKIKLIQLKYVDAAKHFAQAAGVLPPGEEYDGT
jgi:hypothetical protein